MMRQTIDEYLDGMLDAQSRAAVEQAIARDPAAAALVKTMQGERALRAAAYASYQPPAREASALATQILEACRDEAAAPIGRVGIPAWVRYVSSVAAAAVIAITAFNAGRMSAPQQVVTVEKESFALYVKPVARNEDTTPRLFRYTSTDEFEGKIRELEAPSDVQIAGAPELMLPGQL